MDRFVSAVSTHLDGPVTPEILRLAGETADQVVRRAELLFPEHDQRNFAPPVFEMLSNLAVFAGDAGAKLGDSRLESSGKAAARRFWFHTDPATGQVKRAYWHPDTPFQLQVEVTNHCNLQCTMCPRTTTMSRPLGHMDIDVWDGILQSWSGRDLRIDLLNPLTRRPAQARVRGGVRLYYLGEFLMHPQFERIVAIAAERDCAIGIQTNGQLLVKRSVRQRLLDAAPPAIGISIDGMDARSYEHLRAGGRWEAVKRGIETFIAERAARGLEDKIALRLHTIVPDESEQTRARIQEFLQTIGDGSIPISYLPLSATNPATFIDSSGNVMKYDFKPDHEVSADHPSCLEPLQKMQILWDGNVSACCVDADGVIRVGSVGMGVDAVWNGPELRRLKEAHLHHDLSQFPLCQKCLNVDAEGHRLW
jgi:pyruvate-formate lyase-activating enzyme